MFDKQKVLQLYLEHKSCRKVAKLTGFSRRTVGRYVNEYKSLLASIDECNSDAYIVEYQNKILEKPKTRVASRPKVKFMGLLENRFYQLIELDEERNKVLGVNKQQLNGAILYRQLKREGFDIGESCIRANFSLYKKKHPEVFIRQEYEYGDRAEFDFHQIKVLIAGKPCIYHQATITLPASNYVFGRLYKNEKIESVLDSLISFFSHCNGVPREVTFDNLSPVVKRLIVKGEKQYTEDIIKLSLYYGFVINTCNPRKGNEKGHVENGGKLARKELFSLKYEFESEEELMTYYHDQLQEYNKTSIVKFDEEIGFLHKKPVNDYVVATFGTAKVNPYSCVSIKGNFYSVQEEYVDRVVTYVIIKDSLTISADSKTIGIHKIKDGSGIYSIDIHHFLNAFLRKPGALKRSVALHQADEELQAIFNKYYSNNPKGFIMRLLGLEQNASNDQEIDLNQSCLHQLEKINSLFIGDNTNG